MQATKINGSKLISAVAVLAALFAIGAPARAQWARTRSSEGGSLEVNPGAVNFGKVNVGASSNPATVTLTNRSRSSVTVSNVALSLLEVTYSGPELPATIAAGQSVTATLRFEPNAAQKYTGTLTFTESNGRTVSEEISGTGAAASSSTPMPTSSPTPAPAPTPTPTPTPAPTPTPTPAPAPAQLTLGSSALSFGSVTVGSTTTQTVQVSNTGGSNLTVSGVSVSGAGFNASGISAGTILAPGQSSTLTVSFDPSSTGNATGSVTVATSVSSGAITLSGSGAAVPVSYSAALSWALDSSATTGYNVYSSTVSGGPYTKLTSTPVTPTSYTDSTVQSGQTYYYVVTGVGANNVESGYSNQVTAQIP